MTRPFPITHDDTLTAIPWDAIEPHERQAFENHRMTLTQLADRGGLTPCEAVAIIEGRPWERMAYSVARQKLIDYVAGAGFTPQQVAAEPANDLQQALDLVRSMRDGKQVLTRWNLNRLEVMLERMMR